MEPQSQLAVREPMSLATMRDFAADIAKSGMFGITNPAQAVCLMMICQSEGIDPVMALKRYHLIENKPSMRADAMQGEFQMHGGAIIWHIRTDAMVAATLFADKNKIDDTARERAVTRFNKLWLLDNEDNSDVIAQLMGELALLSREGEETLIRTYADCDEKGLTKTWKKDDRAEGGGKYVTKTNWKQSPRQMLTARVITEGVRVIAPGLIAGVYTPDEVEDIVASLPAPAMALPVGAKKRDVKAIEDMIDQHIQEAASAKPERKRELLGLISELRCELTDMGIESDIIMTDEATPSGFVMRLKDSEPDEIPGIQASSEPELIVNDPRREVPWQDYILQHVKSPTLRGKRLGDFSTEDITVIYNKIPPGALDSPDKGIRADAEYIVKAFKAQGEKPQPATKEKKK